MAASFFFFLWQLMLSFSCFLRDVFLSKREFVWLALVLCWGEAEKVHRVPLGVFFRQFGMREKKNIKNNELCTQRLKILFLFYLFS